MRVKCPGCGAELEILSQERTVKCDFCGRSFLYDPKGLVLTEVILPVIEKGVAEKVLGEKVETRYYPFYRFSKGERTVYVPGHDEPALRSFIPQGDRVSPEFPLPPPEKGLEEAQSLSGMKEFDSCLIVYSPFYLSSSGILMDGVTGRMFYEKVDEKREDTREHYAFLGLGVLTLVVPFPFNLITIPFYFLWRRIWRS